MVYVIRICLYSNDFQTVAGEGIASPTGKEIDGKYLDQNEADLRKKYENFKAEWPTFGVTLMCDSWTGPTKMNVINFLIYCNGVMWFHKSIDATGHSQDSAYLLTVRPKYYAIPHSICYLVATKNCSFIDQEIRKVVRDIGSEHIVHIVTDNGSNYKKACQDLNDEYPHILWTPCLAHTINLMLKDIGKRVEHAGMIATCKRISTWLHNHSQLNYMMRQAIGGELVKWNATRFGTNYMFMDSFLRKRDQFMQWMGSPEFLQSKWGQSEEGHFAHARLSSIQWWEGLKYTIDSVGPIYKFLRFADQDKRPNLCEVVYQYQRCKEELERFFGRNKPMYEEYREIMDKRIQDVYYDSYVGPGTVIAFVYYDEYVSFANLTCFICCSCCTEPETVL